MFHVEFWKFIYFRVKRSKVRVTRHKNSAGKNGAGMFLCTLVSAGFLLSTFTVSLVIFRRLQVQGH